MKTRQLPARAIRASSIIHRGASNHSFNEHRPVDASLRRLMHGKVQPMQEPSFWRRLFGARP